jgi:hypothetical protein
MNYFEIMFYGLFQNNHPLAKALWPAMAKLVKLPWPKISQSNSQGI